MVAARLSTCCCPGDFFGFDEKNHQSLIEAVADDTTIACYLRSRAELIADSNPDVARAIRQVAFLLSMIERMSNRAKDEFTRCPATRSPTTSPFRRDRQPLADGT